MLTEHMTSLLNSVWSKPELGSNIIAIVTAISQNIIAIQILDLGNVFNYISNSARESA